MFPALGRFKHHWNCSILWYLQDILQERNKILHFFLFKGKHREKPLGSFFKHLWNSVVWSKFLPLPSHFDFLPACPQCSQTGNIPLTQPAGNSNSSQYSTVTTTKDHTLHMGHVSVFVQVHPVSRVPKTAASSKYRWEKDPWNCPMGKVTAPSSMDTSCWCPVRSRLVSSVS